MAENLSSSPLFVGRYRFQAVGHDWDRGRSGYTHLVFDIKNERIAVIKRAELSSQQDVERLKNEVGVLLDLRGPGVPEIYDKGEAEYGSKNYFYMVIEYIDGIRVEKDLDNLSPVERAEILVQLFGILARAHAMGIINRDIDLKHLFWRRDDQQLVVIDWGNAKISADPKQKSESAIDLARSAEILWSLVTTRSHQRKIGPLVLPKDSELLPGLAPIPTEFRNLCKWAPRTAGTNMQSPYTAQELLHVAKGWRKGVPYRQVKRSNWVLRFLFMGMILFLLVWGMIPGSPLHQVIFPGTSTPVASSPSAPPPTEMLEPTETSLPTEAATSVPSPTLAEPTVTPPTLITPAPRSYAEATPALLIDRNFLSNICWEPTTTSSLGLQQNSDGFTRREDRHWRFATFQDHPADTSVQVDFHPCFADRQISGVGLNLWVGQLRIEPASQNQPQQYKPENEIGLFIESTDGQRREYTIWVDQEKSLHVRVRENNEIVLDEVRAVVNNLRVRKSFPRSYAEFSIRIFLEIDNGQLDILYLDDGSLTQLAGTIDDFVLDDINRIDGAVHQNIGEIQAVGIIGYGGATQTIIWPLVFFEQ